MNTSINITKRKPSCKLRHTLLLAPRSIQINECLFRQWNDMEFKTEVDFARKSRSSNGIHTSKLGVSKVPLRRTDKKFLSTYFNALE